MRAENDQSPNSVILVTGALLKQRGEGKGSFSNPKKPMLIISPRMCRFGPAWAESTHEGSLTLYQTMKIGAAERSHHYAAISAQRLL